MNFVSCYQKRYTLSVYYYMKNRYTVAQHSVYHIGYHVVWCPKYRKPCLIGDVEADLRLLLTEYSKEIGVTIETMDIMPDHVHLFVTAPPSISVHNIIGWLKGYTSHALRQKYDHLRTKLPTLWTRAYYAGSTGVVNESIIRSYIVSQKGR